jgi:hypothetical protein
VKEECLEKLILFGEGSLRRALTDFIFQRPFSLRGEITRAKATSLISRINRQPNAAPDMAWDAEND